MLALFAVGGFGQISYPELQFPEQKLGLVTHIREHPSRLNMTVIQCLGNMLSDRLQEMSTLQVWPRKNKATNREIYSWWRLPFWFLICPLISTNCLSELRGEIAPTLWSLSLFRLPPHIHILGKDLIIWWAGQTNSQKWLWVKGRTQVSLSQAPHTLTVPLRISFHPQPPSWKCSYKVSPPGEPLHFLSVCSCSAGWEDCPLLDLRGISGNPKRLLDPSLLCAQPCSSEEASKRAVGKQHRPSCTVFPAGLFLFHSSFTPGHTEGWEDA